MSESGEPAAGGSEAVSAAPAAIRRIGRRRVEWRPIREAGDAAPATGPTSEVVDEAAAGRLSGTGPDDDKPRAGAADDAASSDAGRDAWLHAQRPPHWE